MIWKDIIQFLTQLINILPILSLINKELNSPTGILIRIQTFWSINKLTSYVRWSLTFDYMMMSKKTSLGRQKIAIAKIHNKNRLQVTFSKRRTGLFKKASELCTLCGVEIAILVFSPTNKVFSFGHPDVNSIIDRFLCSDQTSNKSTTAMKMLESYSRNDNIRHLNMMLAQLYGQLEEERERGKKLDQFRKDRQQQWLGSSIDELKVNQLQQLKMALEELKKKVKMQMDSVNSVPPLPAAAADHSTVMLPILSSIDPGNISHLIHFPQGNSIFGSLS